MTNDMQNMTHDSLGIDDMYDEDPAEKKNWK